MSKKGKHEEHENHERWLVSYADFITLLFAFFVVMYSVSSVNEGKFRAVSDSIKAALNPIVSQPASTMRFSLGDHKGSLVPEIDKKVMFMRKAERVVQSHKVVNPREIQISIRDNNRPVESRSIVVTINDAVLFESGRAELKAEALPLLEAFAEVLIEYGKGVRIEGHTDNVPVTSAQFPSNWELSALRAAAVARILTELYRVPPDLVGATGYGQFRPAVDNLTPDNRAKNRRVEMVVQE